MVGWMLCWMVQWIIQTPIESGPCSSARRSTAIATKGDQKTFFPPRSSCTPSGGSINDKHRERAVKCGASERRFAPLSSDKILLTEVYVGKHASCCLLDANYGSRICDNYVLSISHCALKFETSWKLEGRVGIWGRVRRT